MQQEFRKPRKPTQKDHSRPPASSCFPIRNLRASKHFYSGKKTHLDSCDEAHVTTFSGAKYAWVAQDCCSSSTCSSLWRRRACSHPSLRMIPASPAASSPRSAVGESLLRDCALVCLVRFHVRWQSRRGVGYTATRLYAPF